jgi:DNA-directed RNA polymerase subunit E"
MHEYRACRKCHRVTEEFKCPDCGGETVLEWDGFVYILNSKNSKIAQHMNVSKDEQYAIKVR